MKVIAESVLLCLSLLEAILVLMPFGLSCIVSYSTLMLIGWVIEILILKETEYATQIELYNNLEAIG